MGQHDLLPVIPEGLIQAINQGDCVAFVGAGTSGAASLPSWPDLLRRLADADGVPPHLRAHVSDQVARGSAQALDQAAQVLEDTLVLSGLRHQGLEGA